MLEALGGATGQLVGVALDGLVLRHQIIANNVANATTPGFMPKRVNFEEILSDIFSDTLNEKPISADRLQDARDSIRSPSAIESYSGNVSSLDTEMINLTQNVIRYRAIIEANTKRVTPISLAIEDIKG